MAEANTSEKAWKEAARRDQQMLYEMLGDRDWDCYQDIEIEFLERNIGLAMYGPPEELPDKHQNGGTGYSRNNLEHIRKVCATIQMCNNQPFEIPDPDAELLVATIFVCLNLESSSVRVPVFRTPSSKPGHAFVDSSCRVYESWDHYLNTNQLPKCCYCYPANGVYDSDENDQVVVEFGKTPACKLSQQLCSVLDTTSTMVVVGGLAVTVAGMFTPVAPALLAASTSSALTTGVYGALRSLAALVDRGKHQQSMSVDDPEARACWLAMAGNSLGVASAKSVQTITKLTQQGQVISKTCRVAANVLNVGSLAVNGLGLANNFVELTKKNDCGEMTKLDVFQFASSVLFFTMSAVNLKTADTIIKETQTNVIENFESSLRSNRHRRMFRRVAKQTQGKEGNTMQGNAKVIKCISHIDDKDNFFAGLVRVQKQFGKSEAKVSLTDTGMVKLNGELHVDPVKFAQMDKATRQVILDATKNVSRGTWSMDRFNTEIHAICQEHQIELKSQRPTTIATINRSLQNKSCQVTRLSPMQVDIITRVLEAFAEQFRQRVMDIAVQMMETLGYRKTFEQLVDVVKFVVPFISKIISEANGKYEVDLVKARQLQGASFNKEEFDAQYNMEGAALCHFTNAALNSFMIKEGIDKLCALYQTFMSEYRENQAKKKASVPSSSNCVLYTRNRNFQMEGVLSDEELYEIAQEVTGLYLFEGNTVLCREGDLSFITVQDKHLVNVTVLITSDVRCNKITASIIL